VNCRTATAIPLVMAAALALAGCSGTGAGADGTPQRGSESSTSSTSSTEPAPTPSVYDDATAQPAPKASEGAQDSAVTAAEKVVRTYAQPKLSPDAWAQQMTPLLSQSGAVAYEGQDPTTIPATKVTGSGKIVGGATDVALNVLVPTDAGEYNVALSRSGDSAPWLANEIRPVDGE
jgi:hypothetical protein